MEFTLEHTEENTTLVAPDQSGGRKIQKVYMLTFLSMDRKSEVRYVVTEDALKQKFVVGKIYKVDFTPVKLTD